MRLSLRSFKND